MQVRLINGKLLENVKGTLKETGVSIAQKNKELLIPYSQIKWVEKGTVKDSAELKSRLDA